MKINSQIGHFVHGGDGLTAPFFSVAASSSPNTSPPNRDPPVLPPRPPPGTRMTVPFFQEGSGSPPTLTCICFLVLETVGWKISISCNLFRCDVIVKKKRFSNNWLCGENLPLIGGSLQKGPVIRTFIFCVYLNKHWSDQRSEMPRPSCDVTLVFYPICITCIAIRQLCLWEA